MGRSLSGRGEGAYEGGYPMFATKARIFLLRTAKLCGAFALSRALTRKSVRVLCYHGAWISDVPFSGDAMFIRPETFAARISRLRDLGYEPVSLGDAVEMMKGTRPMRGVPVVVTIDDGWYSTASAMAPALQEHRIPATLYCHSEPVVTGNWIPNVLASYLHQLSGYPKLAPPIEAAMKTACDTASPLEARLSAAKVVAEALGYDIESIIKSRNFSYMTPDELKDLFDRGIVDVQLHTHTHSLHDLSPKAVQDELDRNADVLAGILGVARQHFVHFCYPSGLSSRSAVEALLDHGVESATTVADGIAMPETHRLLIPRIIDGDNLHTLDFEAEMSGFKMLLRKVLGMKSQAHGYLPDVSAVPQPGTPPARHATTELAPSLAR